MMHDARSAGWLIQMQSRQRVRMGLLLAAHTGTSVWLDVNLSADLNQAYAEQKLGSSIG